MFIVANTLIAVPSLSDVKKAFINKFYPISLEKQELLGDVDTIAEASSVLQNLIAELPQKNIRVADEYFDKNKVALLRCAKVLSQETEVQFLKTLQEIERRLAYWKYQQKNPGWYRFTKNPFKWFVAKSQSEELRNNIEQLEHTQRDLYTYLGELSVHWGNYLIAFNTYEGAYAWINDLLELLPWLNTDSRVVIVERLNKALERVGLLQDIILANIADAAVPHHVERNWILYGGLAVGAIYAYGYRDIMQRWIGDKETGLPSKITGIKTSLFEKTEATKHLINETFFGITDDSGGLLVQKANLKALEDSIENFLKQMSEKRLTIFPGYISEERAHAILEDVKSGDSASFQILLNEIAASKWLSWQYYIQAMSLFGQLFGLQSGSRVQKTLGGASNISLLTPAALTGAAVYSGLNKAYQKIIARDYHAMRYTLLQIQNLCINKTAIDAQEYGELLYRVYNLKEHAKKNVPTRDEESFMNDLKMLESREFDVAAKRRKVKDMFAYYSFLK